MRKIVALFSFFLMVSCASTSGLKTVDDTVIGPRLLSGCNCFELTEYAKDKKYGFKEDYPINVGFTSIEDGENNEMRFLRALVGPNGEEVTFTKKESCCPFPTKKTDMGAGFLDLYEITWKGNAKPVIIYLNKFEKGKLLIPMGFTAKKL